MLFFAFASSNSFPKLEGFNEKMKVFFINTSFHDSLPAANTSKLKDGLRTGTYIFTGMCTGLGPHGTSSAIKIWGSRLVYKKDSFEPILHFRELTQNKMKIFPIFYTFFLVIVLALQNVNLGKK